MPVSYSALYSAVTIPNNAGMGALKVQFALRCPALTICAWAETACRSLATAGRWSAMNGPPEGTNGLPALAKVSGDLAMATGIYTGRQRVWFGFDGRCALRLSGCRWEMGCRIRRVCESVPKVRITTLPDGVRRCSASGSLIKLST